MAQDRISSTGTRLHSWQAVLLLLVFLCVRGLAPAGFMPASITAGTPYDLCHGDSRSAQLLQWLQQYQHQHGETHQHDTLTAHAFADNHCSFSAAAGLAATPAVEPEFFLAGIIAPALPSTSTTALTRAYALPHSRAPPHVQSVHR